MSELSPLTRRRLNLFCANRRGFWSLWIFLFLFFVTLFAEFIANDKPLVVSYRGSVYFPVFTTYSEKFFGGDFDTEAMYRDPFIADKINEDGWMLWPPIRYEYSTINYATPTPNPSPPSGENWLGTDDQGRDVLARLIYGFRISVLFGLALTIVSSVVGVLAGAVQGYFGGWVDLLFQRFIEIWSGLPELFLLIILASIVTPNFWWLLGILLLFSWMSLTAVVRAEFLRARNFDYVKAARALGVTEARIMVRHVLPNALVSAMTYIPFVMSAGVTALTTLDFLGFGLPPGSPSLGELLLQGKSNPDAPWLGFTGFTVIAGMLVLIIFISEAVRDAFDPEKGGRMTLLSVDKLSLSFGPVKAVNNISFNMQKGEMLAVVGESGSGKSLTALSCLGLQPASARISGSITFDGQEVIGTGESVLRTIRGARISMIFQEPMTALNPLHTLGKQIEEMLTLHQRLRPDQTRARIQELLEQVGLAHFKDRLGAYPHQLSGGERQRVMIAMAIANGPDLLIADEPTTAVDVTIQARILKLLKRLQGEMGMGILFITHDLSIVRKLADRVAVMSKGEIVEQGKVADIFSKPSHPYTKQLLASEPKGEAIPLPANPTTMMECVDLKVHFPIKKGLLQRVTGHIKAIDGVTVTIPESSTLGVVGESGSGKTTLGFALLRLLKSQGRIVFLGQDIGKLSGSQVRPLRQRMQVVFQDPYSSLNPRMNVRSIIEEGLLVHHRDRSEAERLSEIDSILKDVGLSPDMKERFPHEFSGGQRQRISIARAMVLRPKFVILDEPTSALDLTVQTQIIDLLKDLQKKYGLSYMFISHDLRVVKAIAHEIIVMHRGLVVEQNDTKTIFTSPQHDYTKTLINAAFMKE